MFLAHCDYLFCNHSFVIGGSAYTIEFIDIHMTEWSMAIHRFPMEKDVI